MISTTISIKAQLTQKSWTKDSYFISTNPRLVSVAKLIDIFDSDDFYWAKTLPEPAMQEMVENSLVFGLYPTLTDSTSESHPIPTPDSSTSQRTNMLGFARCVTDFTTFLYLTDVWVDRACQCKGLGTWLVRCIDEVIEDMPHLRRSMLFTADWKRSVPFYEKNMRMNLVLTRFGEDLAVMEKKGRGHPSYGSVGNNYRLPDA